MKLKNATNQFEIEALEPRLLLSADGLACANETGLRQESLPTLHLTAEVALAAVVAANPAEQVADILGGLTEDQPVIGDPAPDPTAPAATGQQAQNSVAAQSNESALVSATQPAQSSQNPVLEAATLAGAGASPTALANSAAQQLTETLHAANGPPATSGTLLHLTPDVIWNLGTTLVIGPYDRLTGTGRIFGNVINNGILSPGNSPGITNFTTFDQGAGATTIIEIGGTAGAGVYNPPSGPNGWDQVQVSGTATLNGTLQIVLFDGYVPTGGESFQIFTWGSYSGEFDNWLGTANIPGHPDLSFKPTYSAGGLTLTVVQTPTLTGPVGAAIDSGLDTLHTVADKLDAAGEFAEKIPFIGSKLGDLADSGTAITNAIRGQLTTLLNSTPRVSDVTNAIQLWNGTTVGGFAIAVKGLLAHYGTLSTDPIWWEVNLDLTPTALNKQIEDVLGGVFGALMSGTPPTVAVNTTLNLDFAFGYDSGFFVQVSSVGMTATVNASGLGSFGFNFNTPSGTQGLSVSGGTVALTASVTAKPDDSILTGGRITGTTLSSIASGGIAVGDAFNLTNSGTLNATFPFTTDLTFLGFDLSGDYALRITDSNLLDADAPDVSLDVNSDFTYSKQTLHGSFTLKNTGTETILLASGVNYELKASSTRIFSIKNGAGTFVLLGSDIAGTLAADLDLGPDIPNLTLSLTGITLRFNSSSGAVDTIDGVTVNLPAGPYWRVSGNGSISVANIGASLSGDFVFEPRDTDANTGNGYEETAVGVANLAFAFKNNANNPLLSVTNATGAFVFRTTGIVGSLTATASLTSSALSLNGVFTVTLNDTASSYNQSVDVNGTTVTVNAPAGPYLQVTAKGNTTDGDTTNDHATLTVLGITLTGDFTFESKTATPSSAKVVTVTASSVSLDLGSVANDLISVSGGGGTFIITDDGVAGEATNFAVSIGVSSLSLSGTFSLRINTTEAAVNETVTIGGVNKIINVPIGPYLQVNGTGVDLTVLGVKLTGDFSFEQRETAGGAQLVTVIADNVHFNFGTSGIL